MKKNIWGICCSIFLLAVGGCCCEKKAAPAAMEQQALLIDVRTPGEYAQGFLKGAVNLPHDRIGAMIDDVAPDKIVPLYLYCRSGRRVGLAIKTLKGKGYTVIHDLGGFEEARKKLGVPVIKKSLP